MKIFLCLFLILIQDTAFTRDTLRTLSESEFLNIVRTNHPMVKQANLLVERAKADLTASRAGFDPQFYVYADRKTFDGKNYYDYTNPELKIPTWFGVEVKAGLENNLGDYLNPELTQGQSSYVGLSVPVAKNLLMDKRRAVLMQAKIFREQSKTEQSLIINDLLIDAVESYWSWVQHYEIFRILKETVTLNETRFELVKLGYRQGDRPAIDTTEALAQLQSFVMAKNDAWLNARNAALDLSNFLWTQNDSAFYLTENIIPDSSWRIMNIANAQMPALNELLQIASENHPKLQNFDFKLQVLDIEKRLKFQNILPVLNVRYNILNEGYNVFKDASTAFYRNNYKFGFDFGLPLRLSQGRGEYRSAKLKIQETNLDLIQTRLSINNKVRMYFNELANLKSQVGIAENNLENYRRLFRAEDTRFRIGESSLFIVNARENKVLETAQKWVELKTKFMKTYQAVIWSTGQLR